MKIYLIDPVLRHIVEIIVKEIDPERIILFGSRVRGITKCSFRTATDMGCYKGISVPKILRFHNPLSR